MIFGGEWEDHLPRVCFAYNTSQQESTGFTPFYLMFGRQARIPLDIMYQIPVTEARNASQYMWTLHKPLQDAYALACDNLQIASSRQKELYFAAILTDNTALPQSSLTITGDVFCHFRLV